VRLAHQFRVAAPIDEVWSALLDPQRVAPCMPGATLTSVDGESFAGTVKVKLGPVTLLYKGTGSFESADADARRAVLKASGKDSRGNGTASATVEVTLSADGGGTVAAVVTELTVTGRPAQFGRGMITEVGGKILDRFAECLAGKLAPAEAAPAENRPPEPVAEAEPVDDGPLEPAAEAVPVRPSAPAPDPPPAAEPIDLLAVAGAPVAKRAVVAVGAIALLIVIVAWLRRR
jgi:carbon monoxide dehydrogenase subunit G